MSDSKEKVKKISGISIHGEDRYWGKAPKEELEKALKCIDKEGWEVFKERYRGKFDFTFDENRADWRFNIPIDKSYRVLDAGAGMGRISIPLARIVGRVVSVDQSFLRLKFLKKRSELEGLKNIELVLGDIFDLPLEKGSFDLIVMNGLLEWVGATDRYKDPRVAQLECLKICRSLLREGGYLYIGIENRFALAYLKGRDHSGLRYTSYMPRTLANMYTKLWKGKRYDTYTYTAGGYRRLLEEAGFSSPDLYLVHPGYNNPRVIIPYGNLNILAHVIKALMPENNFKHTLAKCLAHFKPLLWVYRKLFFSFNIIVRK